MQHLEVRVAVRPLYRSLGVKRLRKTAGLAPTKSSRDRSVTCRTANTLYYSLGSKP